MEKIKALFVQYREIVLYVFFGGLTTLVSIASYWILVDFLHMHYMAATVLSWILSVTFAYVTNRKWVFLSRAHGFLPVLRELVLFYAARLLSGVMEMGLMFGGVSILHLNDKAVKIFANVLVIIANYILSKCFVFRKKHDVDESEQ